MNKYNLNRIERHYMIEVMLSFEDKHGREMTSEEIALAVEKMRAKRKQCLTNGNIRDIIKVQKERSKRL